MTIPATKTPIAKGAAFVGNVPSPRPGRHTAATRKQRKMAKYIAPCPSLSARANVPVPGGVRAKENRRVRRANPAVVAQRAMSMSLR